jgi:ribosomal protein S18 acetylase RimI-like enzyme
MSLEIRPFVESDEDAVVSLWERSGLLRPWNDPRKDIARKLKVQRELFLVAVAEGAVVACLMAGYDGHRGWINYVGVDPAHRRRGVGRAIMLEAERRLREIGCPKINLQVRRDNPGAVEFYARLGYEEYHVLDFGKWLVRDGERPPVGGDQPFSSRSAR